MNEIKNEPIVLKMLNDSIELDGLCYSCVDIDYTDGMKYVVVKNDCSSCNGTHYKPTKIGHIILSFMKRHLK